MSSILLNKALQLVAIFSEPVYILRSISQVFDYESGQKTDKVIGFKYEVVNTGNYEKISVKVEQKKPLISIEKLEELIEADEKIFIEFENAKCKQYYSQRTNTVEDTFTADDIMLVKAN